jgi:BirA family transcriptional regulator, biotin operon repressor / biotin---[acetyl-CoA-carboxylase] ligase
VVEFKNYLKDLERRRRASDHRGPDNLVVVERVDSTNRLARDIAADYEKEAQDLRPLLIVALEQTGGRGRRGHTWESPRGLGVYATLVCPVERPEDLQTLPLLAGVGLCRALSRHLPTPCRLKWPNDLLVEAAPAARPAPGASRRTGTRKIGGVLIEAIVHPGEPALALLGFGVNHGQGAGELPAGATSVAREGRSGVALAELTWELVDAVEEELIHLGDAPYAVARYREHSIHHPGERLSCRVADGTVEGTFLGFDEHGRLRLDAGGRELQLSSGEVIE